MMSFLGTVMKGEAFSSAPVFFLDHPGTNKIIGKETGEITPSHSQKLQFCHPNLKNDSVTC